MSHPALVIWLLQRSGVAESNQPLIGDLLEEYSSGRSGRWLWWQALAVITIAAVSGLWEHKLLALRAVGTGLMVVLPASALKYQITSHPWASGLIAFWLLTLLPFPLAGWVIGLTHREHKAAMLLAFVGYAAVAKTWLYATHFQHYWSVENPQRFILDVGLTAFGLFLIALGGLLPEARFAGRSR